MEASRICVRKGENARETWNAEKSKEGAETESEGESESCGCRKKDACRAFSLAVQTPEKERRSPGSFFSRERSCCLAATCRPSILVRCAPPESAYDTDAETFSLRSSE
uniref:Uncharacterized protein n=1 Tax=Toxoplasma gondii TgCATBr9 TaxID=943120 RepID=A0A2T6IJW9_TOXGO|nr:hypothetical protein TGBR9_384010 [Toxoplasma gondii TgCATBr9]